MKKRKLNANRGRGKQTEKSTSSGDHSTPESALQEERAEPQQDSSPESRRPGATKAEAAAAPALPSTTSGGGAGKAREDGAEGPGPAVATPGTRPAPEVAAVEAEGLLWRERAAPQPDSPPQSQRPEAAEAKGVPEDLRCAELAQQEVAAAASRAREEPEPSAGPPGREAKVQEAGSGPGGAVASAIAPLGGGPETAQEPEAQEAVGEPRPSVATAPQAAAVLPGAGALSRHPGGVGGDAAEEFDEAIIEHVQLLASLIDGEELSRGETIELLRRVLRQHSIAKETGLQYALRRLKEKPP